VYIKVPVMRNSTANLCPSSKNSGFFTRRRRGDRKRAIICDFWGGCFVGRLQPTQTHLHAKSMDY